MERVLGIVYRTNVELEDLEYPAVRLTNVVGVNLHPKVHH